MGNLGEDENTHDSHGEDEVHCGDTNVAMHCNPGDVDMRTCVVVDGQVHDYHLVAVLPHSGLAASHSYVSVDSGRLVTDYHVPQMANAHVCAKGDCPGVDNRSLGN